MGGSTGGGKKEEHKNHENELAKLYSPVGSRCMDLGKRFGFPHQGRKLKEGRKSKWKRDAGTRVGLKPHPVTGHPSKNSCLSEGHELHKKGTKKAIKTATER